MKKNDKKMSHRFITHVRKFMNEAKLWSPSGHAYVGVSGGKDSILLLFILNAFFKEGLFQSLNVLHVNHGVRKESIKEALFVRNLAKEWGLPYFERVLNFESMGNFEFRARHERYRFFNEIIQSDDRIYLAHHLDDSFEWSLLQQFKSSTVTPILGIPVKAKNVFRPFMCVSNKQILHFIKENNLLFCEDQSNANIHFQRNYIRHQVVKPIALKFPHYLEHYVRRSNQLALQWGNSVFLRPEWQLKSFQFFEDQIGTKGFFHQDGEKDFRLIESQLEILINELSDAERGVIRLQLKKFLEGAINGKKGPLIFSGQVWGLMQSGVLTLIGQRARTHLLKIDHVPFILRSDKIWSYEEFLSELMIRINEKKMIFPCWIISRDYSSMQKLISSLKSLHPLWPHTTQYFINEGIWYRSAFDVLFAWKKLIKKDHNKGNYTFKFHFF